MRGPKLWESKIWASASQELVHLGPTIRAMGCVVTLCLGSYRLYAGDTASLCGGAFGSRRGYRRHRPGRRCARDPRELRPRWSDHRHRRTGMGVPDSEAYRLAARSSGGAARAWTSHSPSMTQCGTSCGGFQRLAARLFRQFSPIRQMMQPWHRTCVRRVLRDTTQEF